MTDIKPVEHYHDMFGDTLDVWHSDAVGVVGICYYELMREIQALKAQNEKLESALEIYQNAFRLTDTHIGDVISDSDFDVIKGFLGYDDEDDDE